MSSVYRLHFDETEIKIQQMEALLKSTDRDTQLYGVICDYLGVLRSLKAAYAKLEDAPDMAMLNELQRDAVMQIADFSEPHTAFVLLVREKKDSKLENTHERLTIVSGHASHLTYALATTGLEREDMSLIIQLAADEIKRPAYL